MKEGVRKDFLTWYVEKVRENYVFDLRAELLAYCDSDVDILRRGCLELRREFLEMSNIDPFQYITLPSVCMAIFRANHLQPNTLAVLNTDYKGQYSKASISWLKSFENSEISHALNTDEVEIVGAKVDGYDKSTNTVYQFHGCYWHGCPKCYPDEELLNTVKKTSMGDLYEATLERSN